MEKLLITLGDSFTYGEGLDFYVWQQRYNSSYEIYKFPYNNNFPVKRIFQWTNQEFIKFRTSNRYANLLNEKLGTELLIQSNNGGTNINRLNDLDILIELFKNEPTLIPQYCIFQFTHTCRDVGAILNKTVQDGSNSHNNALDIFGEKFCKKIENKIDDLDYIINEILIKEIEILKLKFEFLEKTYNCKCFYFFGLGDVNSINNNNELFKKDHQFIELNYNSQNYASWLELIEKNNLRLQDTIGVNDDHPNLESHKWLSEYLYHKII
jgi:hypothetical protein